MKLLKYENAKLSHQLIFNLPATPQICGRVCPGCYAAKAQVRFKAVLLSRERNYLASQLPSFPSRVIAEILVCKRPLVAVRVHESGEFYSQEYLDYWTEIATALPHITFYAFTKRRAHFDFTTLSSLPNVVIINSIQHGALNYGPAAKLLPSVHTCPCAPGVHIRCGIDCTYCMQKSAQLNGVQFLQH